MEIIFHKGINYLKTSTGYKEVLSTTDKSLGLPEPSEGFIKAYIEAYNKGNSITEVDVEYETIQTTKKEDYQYFNGTSNLNYTTNLKTNPKDNTITIKKIKDIWNREEMEGFVDEILRDFRRDCLPFGEYPDYVIMEFKNNWIKQNL